MIDLRSRWLLPALFVAALLPRLYHVRSPYMSFADHNTANFSIFARNYLEQGYYATRLGQVRDVARRDAGDSTVFAHHPPAIAILTSFSFALLGVSEWAARLLPLAFSAATCPVLFLIGKRLSGDGWGLIAAGLFAFSPGSIYFGQMLDHESFVTLLGLLSILSWRRHAETGSARWWRACLLLIAAATLTDWPGAYLAPAVAAASWLAPATRERRVTMALSAFAAAGAALALVVLHILILKGSPGDLLRSLSFRVFSSPDLAFSSAEYLYRIRLNLEDALTPPVFWMAVAGGGAVLGAAALERGGGGARKGPPPSGGSARGPGVGAPPLAAAVGIFGGAHHAIFRNACHYNEHLVYYLLPPAILLAAAGPAAAARVLGKRWARGPAVAAASLIAAWPLALFVLQAPSQVWSYFNVASVPGWPLLGQGLSRVVPEDGVLFSTENPANPQFLHYLRRNGLNEVKEAELRALGGSGAFLMRDLNAPADESTLAYLSPFPPAGVLNFFLYDLGAGSPSPEIPALRPVSSEWSPVEIRFGDALLLSMARYAPSSVTLHPVSPLERFLGVRWTPERAAGRIVHASFIWERLPGKAATLEPEYDLVVDAGGPVRAPRMWPLAPEARDLAALSSGESSRHEVDWFLGEWLPEGDYKLEVAIRDGARALRMRTGEGAVLSDRSLLLGSVHVANPAVDGA